MKLIDLVKDRYATFSFYKDKELWYETDSGFSFPIPVEMAENSYFSRREKAIVFMRYIRKHLAYIEKSREEAHDE
jgi:hypothetical protein